MKAKFKSKYKFAITLSIFLVLASTMVMVVPAATVDTDCILMIDIMAKGPDFDVPGATSFIKARIEFNKFTGECLGQVEFHLKLYDESGKKIYSMKGELKDAAVIPGQVFPCDVRDVTWTNLWLIMGEGKLRTTDIDIEMEYRGNLITLPNTGGQYITMPLVFLGSQFGEYIGGVWDEGGWAFAGIMGEFGAGAYLTKYMIKYVP